MSEIIAVTGAGLIGRSWAIVFARAGFSVRLHDIDPEALAPAKAYIGRACEDLRKAGLLEDAERVVGHIVTVPELGEALAGAVYAQECGPETEAAKRGIFAELDRLSSPSTVLASSTSGIVASRFCQELAHPERCLVAHPVNPPALVPLVEVVPSPKTTESATKETIKLMQRCGQAPIRVRREIDGFVLNRLQGALLNEAMRLVAEGCVSAEDADTTVKHGLGMRWSFMGPFETIDLNAPGGLKDYGERYGALFEKIRPQEGNGPLWSPEALSALERERRQQLAASAIGERQAWRDRRLMALARHKQYADEQFGT